MPSTYHNSEGDLSARSEIERRQDYFNYREGRSLGDQHPFIVMIHCCLENRPSERPTSEQLVTRLEQMRDGIGGPLEDDAARIDVMRQMVTVRAMRTIREREAEIRRVNGQIEQLRQQIEQIQVLYDPIMHVCVQAPPCTKLNCTIQTNHSAELAQKNNDIQQRDQQLEEDQQQIARLQVH